MVVMVMVIMKINRNYDNDNNGVDNDGDYNGDVVNNDEFRNAVGTYLQKMACKRSLNTARKASVLVSSNWART
jgi:hypothetical protein